MYSCRARAGDAALLAGRAVLVDQYLDEARIGTAVWRPRDASDNSGEPFGNFLGSRSGRLQFDHGRDHTRL